MPVIAPEYAFDRIVAPMPVDEFVADWFGRRTLVIRRNRPDFFTDLVSATTLDDFLSVNRLTDTQVFAVDARRELTSADYAGPDGLVDPVRLHRLFAEGATISFRQMQDRLAPLAALCRAAEQLFNCPFQTNLYFTPAAARGFRTHHDTHDVFVLQIEGSKRWRVCDPVVPLPLAGQEFAGNEDRVGSAVEEFTLRAGDMFYCPRGFPHDAEATDEPSLHVTFGALVHTWAEVMIEAMAGLCLEDAQFRAALPPGWATGAADPKELETVFRDLARRFADHAGPGSALDGMAEEFIVGRRPQVPGQRAMLDRIDGLGPDSEVGARPGLLWRLDTGTDAARLTCHAGEITFPAHVGEAVGFALEHRRFRVRDLPGDIDDDSRLVLIRRLAVEGLVELF